MNIDWAIFFSFVLAGLLHPLIMISCEIISLLSYTNTSWFCLIPPCWVLICRCCTQNSHFKSERCTLPCLYTSLLQLLLAPQLWYSAFTTWPYLKPPSPFLINTTGLILTSFCWEPLNVAVAAFFKTNLLSILDVSTVCYFSILNWL